MTVIVCAAHPDDEVIGMGGTIAKLSKKEDVIVVIFSYGDKYPITGNRKKIMNERVNEARECDKILGIKKTIFLGLKDLELSKHEDIAVNKLTRIIQYYKPEIVFTHTITDGHPDHRSVNRATLASVSKAFTKTKILTFDINFFNLQKGIKVVYDISETFGTKMKALNLIKSQTGIIRMLKPLILIKAIMYGIKNKFKYGECFVAI